LRNVPFAGGVRPDMKKLLLITCLVTAYLTVRAQDSKWSVSFSPAFVQSPGLHFAIQPGVEYKFNDRWSLSTEIAIPFGKNNSLDYSHSKYFRIKPELRYYLSKSEKKIRPYVGFQASYTFRNWQSHGGSFYEKGTYANNFISYDRANIKSPIITFSLQLGARVKLTRRLDMDLFMGLGSRTVFTNYFDVQNAVNNPYTRPVCTVFPAPDAAYLVNGTVNRLNLNFGIRFIYHF